MPLSIGLMSGTSIDGIDAALIRITGKPSDLQVKLLHWKIFPFPKGVKEKILAISQPARCRTADICKMNFEIGELFAKAAIGLCRSAKVSLEKIEVIGSHGQTICHLGRSATLQIGEPSVIAERTGVTTVADFRPRDVAAGGFGAPLAPYCHYVLFRDRHQTRAIHNLGGISNLTFIPKNADPEDVIGFDTGPANMVVDGLIQQAFGGKMMHDHGGKIAARGMVSLKLLKDLMTHPFILKKPPKTAGREEFGGHYVKDLLKRALRLHLRFEDAVATATALTAVSLAENYRKFIFAKKVPDEIIFGGGGIRNPTLMRMIRQELSGIPVRTFDDYGISADAAEAVCFALLGYETLQGRPTSLPSVTGAKRSAILGKIVPGSRFPRHVARYGS